MDTPNLNIHHNHVDIAPCRDTHQRNQAWLYHTRNTPKVQNMSFGSCFFPSRRFRNSCLPVVWTLKLIQKWSQCLRTYGQSVTVAVVVMNELVVVVTVVVVVLELVVEAVVVVEQ